MAGHRETAKHLRAFQTWYEADRDYQKTSNILSIPNGTLRTWGDWFGWKARADRLDREAAEKADRDAVKRRAAMLIRHRQAAELMQLRGIERLKGNKISGDRDALTAIKEGVALERQVEGMPSYVVEIMNADAERLDSLIAEYQRGLAACDSPGDAAAAGTLPEYAASNGNGKH